MAHTCANCGCLCTCRGDVRPKDSGETYSCDHCADNQSDIDLMDASDLSEEP